MENLEMKNTATEILPSGWTQQLRERKISELDIKQ